MKSFLFAVVFGICICDPEIAGTAYNAVNPMNMQRSL